MILFNLLLSILYLAQSNIIEENHLDSIFNEIDFENFDLDHPDFYISEDKTEYIKEYWEKKICPIDIINDDQKEDMILHEFSLYPENVQPSGSLKI